MNQTTTNLKDDGKVLGNFQVDMDRRVFGNIPTTLNLHDSQYDACNNDDPKAQMAEAVELPKQRETFCDCYMSLKSCPSKVYRISKVSHSNLSHAMNACFDFSSPVHGGLTDFDFVVDDQDLLLMDSDAVEVFPWSVTLDRLIFFPAFLKNL